jgi:5-formyltetrahydrofolate cyclo-ligase
LGRGKGYYDKLLPLLSSYNIGICYHFQAQESIPSEEFDRRMDEIWTEEGKWF